MKESRYCKKCGCYIPDNFNKCLACNNEVNEEKAISYKKGIGGSGGQGHPYYTSIIFCDKLPTEEEYIEKGIYWEIY